VKREIRRGGKSELHRAGWSVIRTVPFFKKGRDKESATENIPPAKASVLVGKGEKVR
jgi:hypothetical protein